METVGHNKISINIVWVLITGFLVMFMQTGFAMVETGLHPRQERGPHLLDELHGLPDRHARVLGLRLRAADGRRRRPIAALGGTRAPQPRGRRSPSSGRRSSCSGPGASSWAATSTTWASSRSSSSRWSSWTPRSRSRPAPWPSAGSGRRSSSTGSSCRWSSTRSSATGSGAAAGSPTSARTSASATATSTSPARRSCTWSAASPRSPGAIVIGPRLGKFDKNGKPVAIPGHHIPMALVGTLILAFGWFGFNPGSTLAGDRPAHHRRRHEHDARRHRRRLTAMLFMMWRFGKPDPSMMCNGMLAGLVAITAPCAFVTAPVSIADRRDRRRAGVPRRSSSSRARSRSTTRSARSRVHGVNGAWGVISLGLFADGTYGDGWNGVAGTVKGLFYGDGSQLAGPAHREPPPASCSSS